MGCGFASGSRRTAELAPPREHTYCRKEVKKVLVIRSCEADDRRRKDLEHAAKDYLSRSGKGLTLEWRDVNCVEDLESALNSFDGSVMVFDGHGVHSSVDEPGALVIGGKSVDPATLRKKVRIPPIVVLSACDTARLDLSHATSTGAFLLLGATSINSFNDDWLEKTFDVIAVVSGSDIESIAYACQDVAFFTDTQSYVHFGWPEDIFVVGSKYPERVKEIELTCPPPSATP